MDSKTTATLRYYLGEGLVAAVVIAILSVFLFANSHASPEDRVTTGSKKKIAILPFRRQNVTARLAEATLDSIDIYLNESPDLRAIPSDSVIATLNQMGLIVGTSVACAKPECATKVARKLKVGSIAIGSISLFGRLLSVSISIVDAHSGKIVHQYTAKSTLGTGGVTEVSTEIANSIINAVPLLPIYDNSLAGDLEGQVKRRSRKFIPHVAFDFSTGIYGYDSSLNNIKSDNRVTISKTLSAKLRWMADISIGAHMPDTRISMGVRLGIISAKTALFAVARDTIQENSMRQEHLHRVAYISPQLGYRLFEGNTWQVTLLFGSGYRSFSQESQVSNVFVLSSLDLRWHLVHIGLTYWYGVSSETVLRNLVTISAGLHWTLKPRR